MDRRPSDKQDVVTTYSLDDYPEEIKKKVTLLQHFKNYLEGEKKEDNQVKKFFEKVY